MIRGRSSRRIVLTSLSPGTLLINWDLTKIHKANSHRILIPAGHMIKDLACARIMSDSVALTDHIRVLDHTRFEQPKMGKMSDTAMGGIELGLAFLFDIR